MNLLNISFLDINQWVWLIIASFLIGLSKTGLTGVLTLIIPILASVFGGKVSTGIILPMLIVGDILALVYYKTHANIKDLVKLLPWTFGGILIGVLVGKYIDDELFKRLISISVFVCLILLVYFEKKGDNIKVPDKTWFYGLTGIAAGFTSMIGNAAGPLFSVYLLSKGYEKKNYMGLTAWFFFIVNVTKLPIQAFVWKNITLQTLFLNLLTVPVIVVGAVIGVYIIKKINEKMFRYLIIVLTAIVSIRLLF